MTYYAENETQMELPFDWKELFALAAETVLDSSNCPYEVEVSLLLTDGERIKEMNRKTRGIDEVTDVLSFPNLFFPEPANFSLVEEEAADYFHPETGELVLGEMIICMDKLYEQAKSYGHSLEREFAFLVTHSMLHLCGYDHLEQEEEEEMCRLQEEVLCSLGITRD